MMATEKRIALRIPAWLWEDVKESADRSGWDVSKQIRLELAAIRGKATVPSVPQAQNVNSRFKTPSHGTPGKKIRKDPTAA